ncbi:MAG: (5-formylfuran-3-yl)methyl phosphate synthase [Methylococcaceae bacterium]
MTRMLASVANLAEARLVAEEQADFIDLKNPELGALGGLDPHTATHIIHTLKQEFETPCFSATIGDLPLHPQPVIPAVTAMGKTGADYVKIGFFPDGDLDGVMKGLRPVLAEGVRLIAVLFGEDPLDLSLIPRLKDVGFSGVMLDTRDKRKGSLAKRIPTDTLNEFLQTAKKNQLLTGLAGSLTGQEIPVLLSLKPDYLGFRGALCAGTRTATLDRERVRLIRHLITTTD